MTASRQKLTLHEVRAIHDLPLTELVFRAQTVHRQHHQPDAVQLCTLLSIKTGGCPEDCGYCSQSARHEKTIDAQPLMDESEVLEAAQRARDAGATRFCMGAAWRNAKGGEQFKRVLTMVRGVRELGMEACVTLGMLDEQQAKQLKAAGLTAYNHNLDTSREFYGSVVTTRTYDDRLRTLENVRNAGHPRVFGGHPRAGRIGRRPLPHADHAGESAGAAGERADQRAGRGAWHAARRAPADRSV